MPKNKTGISVTVNMNKLNLYIKKLGPTGLGVIIGVMTIFGLIGYAHTRIFSLSNELKILRSQIGSNAAIFAKKTSKLADAIQSLDKKTSGLSDTLSAAERNIQKTKENVEAAQSHIGGVEQTVGKIGGAVNTLEKLSKTDPELLQKYSKVFFLNEHYAPERLTEIDKEHLYSEKRLESIHSLVWPHLKNLLDAAKRDGALLYVKSAYRSFDEQKSVKSAYTVIYGAGNANQFSADQGYSEHQLGTTVDFTTTGLNGALNGFENTRGYEWLLNNGYKYGFILSYPKDNKYYIFEPWHWRFVGITLAARLSAENKNFYDLEQREIDAYLANIFD